MKGPNGDVRVVGLIGVESTGKSTLAHMLVGRLRTHGVKAVLAAEAGSARPFPAELLDTYPAAHFYTVAQKLACEAHAMLRPNVDFVVSDRTPLDLAAYFAVRFKDSKEAQMLEDLARAWVKSTYDVLYYLPAEGAPYAEDGFRAARATNDWREAVDTHLDMLRPWLAPVEVHAVHGTYKERCEWVYHHVLHRFLGKSRPLRAYAQVREWLTQRGFRIVEVRPQGSNSIERFHPSTDHDDIDAMVIVDGDADYAIAVRADIETHRVQLENIVQADLDLLVTPKGLEAHEV